MKYFSFPFLLLFIACSGAKSEHKKSIYVSIAPLAYLVEQIVDTTFEVEILVPETTSPETFEPTSAQIQKLSASKAYFNIGLIDFEVELNKTIAQLASSLVMVDLSEGVQTIEGTCSHATHSHAHGVDPHTWLSPRFMRQFAQRIALEVSRMDPDNSDIYSARLNILLSRIDSLDSFISSSNLTPFAISHPSLSYYARDYEVSQIAIEVDGKEPTIAQMKELIDRLKGAKITKIFYQKQTSSAAAQTIADEIGVPIIEFDPLEKNWIDNLRRITQEIVE